MSSAPVTVRPVASKADKKAFIDLAFRLNAGDPNWVPPLKDEVNGLITPGKNPWFEHAEGAFFLAERDGKVVGRISAQVDRLVLEHMGATDERCMAGTAAQWTAGPAQALNTVAVECIPGPDAIVRARVSGLPDDAFRHDGQLTKREVRAVSLAALAPTPVVEP